MSRKPAAPSLSEATSFLALIDLTDRAFLELEHRFGAPAELKTLEAALRSELDRHLATCFPKVCRNCGRRFTDRTDYLRQTKTLGRRTATFDDESARVHEYRNCVCGSTLLVVLADRRDASEHGRARRRLFDDMVERIQNLLGIDPERVRPQLRLVFQHLLRSRTRSE